MDKLNLFDAISDSAILLDKAGRIIAWNPGAISIFGYTKKDVMSRSVNLIYDRNYPFPKIIQEIHSQKKKWSEETIIIRKNGVKGLCETTLCPLPLSGHNKITVLMTHKNISAYKKTEQALLSSLNQSVTGYLSASSLLMSALNTIDQTEKKLRESELRFHLLAENSTDIISRHKPDGTYLYVSPSCQTTLGYAPDQLMGRNIYKNIHHDDVSKFRKIITRRGERYINKSIIYRIKRKEGDFRWFESNIRLIVDEDKNQINEIQISSRDINDRVLDKKVRLRGQQLAHVYRLSTMEEMASGLAHEISQPLAAIVNFTRGCVRHLQNEHYDLDQLRNIMEKATLQAERAGEIIQRLKNFFCKGQLIKSSCKINNIIREAASLIKSDAALSKIKIDFNFDKNVPFIFIDKIQVQQVILNLMQNAIEAMQEIHIKEKRIQIETKAINKNNIEITLHDAGPGFSKEIINKVFQPFFTTKAHGRGMGLAICRSIIEAHGGQFTINPNLNNQNWVRFSLPIANQ